MLDSIYIQEDDWYSIFEPCVGYIEYGLITSRYRERLMLRLQSGELREVDARFCHKVKNQEMKEKLNRAICG